MAHLLQNYTVNGDWQCHYIRGRCSYICHNKYGRKKVPYRKFVGATESVTLKPRSRTNRGCYNRVKPWLIIIFSSSTCHPTIWNKISRRSIYKTFKDVLCKNSVSTYQRTFYKPLPGTNCVHPRRNACLYNKKSFLFAKRLTTFKIQPTTDSSYGKDGIHESKNLTPQSYLETSCP
jgi:hypothetical protein